ncbi:MAG: hypothetical protein RL591_32 [Planctomycetota bacterium]
MRAAIAAILLSSLCSNLCSSLCSVQDLPWSVRTALAAPTSHAAIAQDAAPVEVGVAPQLELVNAPAAEAEALNRLAMGATWPSRALAVMRLERYDCAPSAARLEAFLLDPSWRVRAYAIACLARRGVVIAPEKLAAERDPRVVRAILRARYPLDEKTRDTRITAVERSQKPLEAMIALEALTALDTPNDKAVRERLDELLSRIVLRMSRAEAGALSRRLAEVTSGEDSGRDFRWREWYRKNRSKPGYRPCDLVPTTPAGERLVPRNRVADLETDRFIAFEQYLAKVAERPMDLAILLDCTSSMWREIADAQGSIDDLVEFLGSVTKGVRIGIVGYRDKTDEWETKAWDFTASLDEARTRLWSLSADGGGDTPESVYAAMRLALTKFSWIKDAPQHAANAPEPPIRACVIVGDAPPHPGEGNLCIDLAKRGLAAGVRFYGVIARDSETNLKSEDPEGTPPPPRTPPTDQTSPAESTTPNPPRDGGEGKNDGKNEGKNGGKNEGKNEGKGRRTPTDKPIAPPKAPPPVMQKERSYTWFPEIAEAGGGRAEILKEQDSLVAEIAELTIADRYREEFADFFAAFRLLCR